MFRLRKSWFILSIAGTCDYGTTLRLAGLPQLFAGPFGVLTRYG